MHRHHDACTTRLQAEIELEQLRREENGSVMTARDQVRTVTAGWLIGTVLGWSAGLVLGCLFSPALGFMLVGLSYRRATFSSSPASRAPRFPRSTEKIVFCFVPHEWCRNTCGTSCLHNHKLAVRP